MPPTTRPLSLVTALMTVGLLAPARDGVASPAVVPDEPATPIVVTEPAPIPVPEPATLLLVGVGVLGIAAGLRRRRSAARRGVVPWP
jgi:PEP-CTERM motif